MPLISELVDKHLKSGLKFGTGIYQILLKQFVLLIVLLLLNVFY